MLDRPAIRSYSHSVRLSRIEYVSLVNKPIETIRVIILMALGAALLTMKYTYVMGLLLLVLTVGRFGAFEFGRRMVGRFYDRTPFLSGQIRYELDDEFLTLHARTLCTRIRWMEIRRWRLTQGWLLIFGHGTPVFFFSVDALRDQGFYEPVVHRLIDLRPGCG